MTPPLFFFGAMSPYSWFAAERIGDMLPAAEWRPVFAGGLFASVGRSSWGLDDRRAAGLADCEARAAQHGLGPIVWPQPWPTVDVIVARATLVAREHGRLQPFALAAMRLAFLEGGDLGDPAVVAEAARRAGLDDDLVSVRVQAPEVKGALRKVTAEAVALGVTGVPTEVVGEEHFWGDDRLADAARAAAAAAAAR